MRAKNARQNIDRPGCGDERRGGNALSNPHGNHRDLLGEVDPRRNQIGQRHPGGQPGSICRKRSVNKDAAKNASRPRRSPREIELMRSLSQGAYTRRKAGRRLAPS